MSDNVISIECASCAARDTSACSDCVANHVLANDAGPIDLVPRHPSRGNLGVEGGRSQARQHDEGDAVAAVELLVRSGLVTDPTFLTTLPVPVVAAR